MCISLGSAGALHSQLFHCVLPRAAIYSPSQGVMMHRGRGCRPVTLEAFLTRALRRCEAAAAAEQWRAFAQALEKKGVSPVRVRAPVRVRPTCHVYIFKARRRWGGGGRGAGPIRFVFLSAGIDLSLRQGELSAIWRRSRSAPRDIGAPLPRLR